MYSHIKSRIVTGTDASKSKNKGRPGSAAGVVDLPALQTALSFTVGGRAGASRAALTSRRSSGNLVGPTAAESRHVALATNEFGRHFVARHQLSEKQLAHQRALTLVVALLNEYGSRLAIPGEELQAVADIADIHDADELADIVDEAVASKKKREMREAQLHNAAFNHNSNHAADGANSSRSPSPRDGRHQRDGTIERLRYLLDRRMHYAPPPPNAALLKSSPYAQSSVASAVFGPTNTPMAPSPRPPVQSAVRNYIRQRSATKAGAALIAREDIVNLRRVLNEIQLKMPALKRLQQQRGGDPDTEAGQVAAFYDVFMLLDEDGSGTCDLDEFVAFGRRVGGESAKIFNKALFSRIDRAKTGQVDKEGFINVLFPQYAANVHRQAEEQAQRKKRETAAVRWEDSWHPDDLLSMREIFARCDANDDGLISFADLQRISKMDWPDAAASVRAQFDALDTDRDGFINFEGLCAMLKPGFDASRNQREFVQKFFFKHVKAGW